MSSSRKKVRPLAEVAAIAAGHRREGRSVVQTHLTFDVFGLGHVRHLEAARQLGDVLVVTIGGGRTTPVGATGAELLAALEFVDWVAIVDDAADRLTAINAIRPAVYAVGQDQRFDPTVERGAVAAHGGRLRFTGAVLSDATGLSGPLRQRLAAHVQDYLGTLRDNSGAAALADLVHRIADFRVLVVGDAIVDEYQYVTPLGKSLKEPIISARHQHSESFVGGAFAVASHVAGFCRQVDLVTCLGEVDSHEKLVRDSLPPNVGLTALVRMGAPSTVKRRLVDPATMRKLFEIYVMDDAPLAAGLQRELDATLRETVRNYDVVIAADFGHGMLARSSVEVLGDARFLAVNAQTNVANLGYNLISKYPGADYVCLDANEARLAAGDRNSDLGDVARRLVEEHIVCPKIIVTQGRDGCVAYERGGVAQVIPACAWNVADTLGAGDAFLALTSPLVAAGGPLDQVGFVGNVASALKLEIIGQRRSVAKPALLSAIADLLQ